jgi:hypothetical protein
MFYELYINNNMINKYQYNIIINGTKRRNI